MITRMAFLNLCESNGIETRSNQLLKLFPTQTHTIIFFEGNYMNTYDYKDVIHKFLTHICPLPFPQFPDAHLLSRFLLTPPVPLKDVHGWFCSILF